MKIEAGRFRPGTTTTLVIIAVLTLTVSPSMTAQPRVGDGSQITLTYNGDSGKVEQVLADCDWTNLSFTDFKNGTGTCTEPTASLTFTNGGVLGADIGHSFQDGNRAIFLFGDTFGSHAYGAKDTFA